MSRSPTPAVEYLPDAEVDASTDQQIRDLLTTCFTKPQDAVFRHQRYFAEPYPNRWVVRDGGGGIVAHVGVHEKALACASGRILRIGGIAEVSVHPEYRGRGYVRAMLAQIHPWLQARGFEFSVLFGNPKVYGSSGYGSVGNLYQRDGDAEWKQVDVMVCPLTEERWPEEAVFLQGPKF